MHRKRSRREPTAWELPLESTTAPREYGAEGRGRLSEAGETDCPVRRERRQSGKEVRRAQPGA